jgi:hypothetical protein
MGSVFGGIVTAIMSAQSDLYSHFCQWIENDYVLDGMDGREGVVVFEHGWRSENGCIIGLFFDLQSELSPYRSGNYDWNRFLREMPPRQRELATPAFEGYMLNTHQDNGIAEITAALWSLDDHLTTNVPWIEMIRNGGSLIEKELKGYSNDAIAHWQSSYEMSPMQVSLAVQLFQQRMIHASSSFQLTADIIQKLHRETADERSFRACQNGLAAMGIILP